MVQLELIFHHTIDGWRHMPLTPNAVQSETSSSTPARCVGRLSRATITPTDNHYASHSSWSRKKCWSSANQSEAVLLTLVFRLFQRAYMILFSLPFIQILLADILTPTALFINCVFAIIGLKCTPSSNRCATPVQAASSQIPPAVNHQNWSIIFLSKLHFESSLSMVTLLASTLDSKAARHNSLQHVVWQDSLLWNLSSMQLQHPLLWVLWKSNCVLASAYTRPLGLPQVDMQG